MRVIKYLNLAGKRYPTYSVVISASCCVFSQVIQARPRVRLRKSGSGLEAPSAAAGHFLFDVNLVVHQPSCAEEQTD